jgi:hypothetical protein
MALLHGMAEYKKVKSSLDIEQNENVGDFDYLQQILRLYLRSLPSQARHAQLQ